jgi:16S rRNA (guanine527-N7)-methyltransferase
VVRKLEAFLALLRKWNERINLTGSTEWESIRPFFDEAAWAAQFYPPASITHLDVGSGAGFPAIPLRILIPRLHLDLIETRGKRSAFLETVIAELGLSETRVFNARLEQFLCSSPSSWDCVSWKAVKLSARDVATLVSRAAPGTRFWAFHGRTAPAEDPGLFESALALEWCRACPAHKGWSLSQYRRSDSRDVSRET